MAGPSIIGWEAQEIGPRKSSPDDYLVNDRSVARQIDELQRISQYERDKVLGRDYFRDIKNFYEIEDTNSNFPSFKPNVKIPQLQTLVLNEATDITDASPKIYISERGNRDKGREEFFQSAWKQGCINNRVLEGFIWAMLSNLGFLQIGFNPRARRGRGSTWVEMRMPDTVYPDPYAKSDADWSFVVWEDWMYIDDVYRIWPDKGRYVQPHLHMAPAEPFGQVEGSLEFPEYSPLSQQGPEGRKIFRDNRARVRHAFLFDNTREAVKEYAGAKTRTDLLVHPRFQYAYPDGRWITECEGVILADGNNWCPQLPDDDRGTFPLIRLSAMPNVTNFWGPPPVKLTRSLQRLSERVYSQTFENVVRLNNGVIVIPNNSGLDPSQIGWLPGEVLQINQGSQPPQVIAPTALPQHMITLPASLLALQKELQGFTAARQGEPGAGNISSDLFDAALWQSKPMTRMRGRLLAESLQRLASIMFYVMARYQQMGQRLPAVQQPNPDELAYSEWHPVGSLDDFDAYLDEGSLSVLSSTMLKSVVSALAKSGMIPTETVLETLGIPNAPELSEQLMRERELQAIAKVRKAR